MPRSYQPKILGNRKTIQSLRGSLKDIYDHYSRLPPPYPSSSDVSQSPEKYNGPHLIIHGPPGVGKHTILFQILTKLGMGYTRSTGEIGRSEKDLWKTARASRLQRHVLILDDIEVLPNRKILSRISFGIPLIIVVNDLEDCLKRINTPPNLVTLSFRPINGKDIATLLSSKEADLPSAILNSGDVRFSQIAYDLNTRVAKARSTLLLCSPSTGDTNSKSCLSEIQPTQQQLLRSASQSLSQGDSRSLASCVENNTDRDTLRSLNTMIHDELPMMSDASNLPLLEVTANLFESFSTSSLFTEACFDPIDGEETTLIDPDFINIGVLNLALHSKKYLTCLSETHDQLSVPSEFLEPNKRRKKRKTLKLDYVFQNPK
jgi:DNA polymerase III delta prime subunit